jgi:iron complex transport system substrate-binding protein
LSAESLASFFPDLVLAPEGDVSKELRYQLKVAGIRLVTFRQEYSTAGAEKLITQVAAVLNNPVKGQELVLKLRKQLEALQPGIRASSKPALKVLFIYARGTGTMTVAGNGSSLASIIELAGGINAVKEFTEFRPYSAEMLVRANPDVILMFDFGLSSLGGVEGLLDLPGMAATKAGRNKRIVQMDGQLLVNFSVRLPEAMETLHNKLYPKP